MHRFRQIFDKTKCAIVGMIHVDALPGTPRFKGSLQKIIDKACGEADIYAKCNIDAVMLENMHDVPYVQSHEFTPETTAIMAVICNEIRKQLPSKIKCGVQVLACGAKESLAISLACDLNFVRVEGFVFGHVGDEGPTWASAGPLLRYRNQIGANNISIWTDIKKKHSSHAITNDVSLLETAKAAEFFLTDGLILTGSATGDPANSAELKQLKDHCKSPIIIGSGVTQENLQEYISADALIIGSYFKKNGYWENDLDSDKIKQFLEKVHILQVNDSIGLKQ